MKNKLLAFFAIALILAASACQNPLVLTLPAQEGSLTLTASTAGATSSRSILPSGMNPASYRLAGTGPSGSSLTQDSSNGTFSVPNLAAGDWNFTVQGLDTAKNVIVSGSAKVSITIGKTASASIKLVPVSTGTGSLSLTVDWSSATSFAADSITGTLTPDSGAAIPLTFSVSGTAATCSQSSLATGSYILAITATKSGVQVSRPLTETVLIYSGQISSGTITLTDKDRCYRVTYNANGGTGTAPTDTAVYAYGSSVTVAGNTGSPALTKSGYTFVGWNTKSGSGYAGTSYAPGATFKMDSSDVTLYAMYTNIAYDGNGATGGSVPVDNSVYPASTAVSVTMKQNTGSLAKTGYAFSGWYSNSAGTGGTAYTPEMSYSLNTSSGAVTIYALWTPVYTVTYDGNNATGGSVPVDSASYLATATVTLLGNTGSLVKTGYVFSGWNTSADGKGTEYAVLDSTQTRTTGSSNLILYARWVPKVASVSAGGWHTVFVTEDGALWAMGDDGAYELGDGAVTTQKSPKQIKASGIKAAFASCDDYFVSSPYQRWTHYLTTDGDLYGVGSNTSGQLGLGASDAKATPAYILNGVDFVSSSNHESTFFVKGGTLYAAGNNVSGQLGINSTTSQTSGFVPVTTNGTDIASVSVGYNHTLVVKTDGTLWSCGSNTNGQLGTGSVSATPVKILTQVSTVSIASDVKAVSTGKFGNVSSYVVLNDGSLWTFGQNDSGQLGRNTTTNYDATLGKVYSSGVASVVAGVENTFVLMSDGTLCAFGNDNYGAFGKGSPTTTSSYTNAITSSVATNVKAVSVGGCVSSGHVCYYTMIVKTDGSLWASGINLYGQLGNGGTASVWTWTRIIF